MKSLIHNNHPFYISSTEGFLQVVAGKLTKDRFKVESISLGKIPLDSFEKGAIKHQDSFSEMITTLKVHAYPQAIDSNFCHLVLPDKYVFCKYLKLPKVKKEELDKTVKFKIKNFLPHQPENMYVDWQFVAESEEETEVSVVAVNKEIIDSYLLTLKSINVYPLSFKPKSFCLAALAGLISLKPALIVYFTEFNVNFSFVKNNAVLFASTIDLSPADKEGEEIIEELQRVTKYWKSTFANKTVSNIFLGGYIKNEEKVIAQLQKSFRLDIKKLPLPVILPRKLSSGRLARIIPLFSLPFIDGKNKTELKKVALIPDKIVEQRENFKFHQNLQGILKITAGFILGIIAIYLFFFLNLFFQVEQTNAALSGLEKVVITPNQRQMEKDAFQLNLKIIALDKIIKRRQMASTYLAGLENKFPAGIVVQELNFNIPSKTVEIAGTASSRQDILNLETSLAELGDVNIPLSSFADSQNSKFKAVLKLK
jgi:hypothetical protein